MHPVMLKPARDYKKKPNTKKLARIAEGQVMINQSRLVINLSWVLKMPFSGSGFSEASM